MLEASACCSCSDASKKTNRAKRTIAIHECRHRRTTFGLKKSVLTVFQVEALYRNLQLQVSKNVKARDFVHLLRTTSPNNFQLRHESVRETGHQSGVKDTFFLVKISSLERVGRQYAVLVCSVQRFPRVVCIVLAFAYQCGADNFLKSGYRFFVVSTQTPPDGKCSTKSSSPSSPSGPQRQEPMVVQGLTSRKSHRMRKVIAIFHGPRYILLPSYLFRRQKKFGLSWMLLTLPVLSFRSDRK
jgi:hypothetical protein